MEFKSAEINNTLRPLEFSCAGAKEATFPVIPGNYKDTDWIIAPSGDKTTNIYSDVVVTRECNEPHENKMYKFIVKSKAIKIVNTSRSYLSQN